MRAPIFTVAPSHNATGPRIREPSIAVALLPMYTGPVEALMVTYSSEVPASTNRFSGLMTLLVELSGAELRDLVSRLKSDSSSTPLIRKICHALVIFLNSDLV